MSLTSVEIKLEILKLAHRHDRSPAQVGETMRAYEELIFGSVDSEFKPRMEEPIKNKKGAQTISSKDRDILS